MLPAGPPDSASRQLLRGVSLAVVILGSAWTLSLVVFGGFDARVLGSRVTTHEPLRPLLFTAAALSVFILSGGSARPRLPGWIAGVDHRVAAGLLASTVLAVGLAYCTTTASGADAYGYVSQADLWIDGEVKVPQPWVARAPWPSRRWAFAPLGYRPVDAAGDWAIVPTYSPGLPLLMAAAKLIGGHCAMFWVVPVSGALLVLATFGLGRRLGASTAGLIAAWLVATSPVFLYMLMWPMTDVPVAAAWSIAFYFLFGRTTSHAAAAGLAAAVGILIRPNLAPAAAIMAIWYIRPIQRADHGRGRAIVNLLSFAAAASVGVIATAAINAHLHGSPLRSGYGGLGDLFAPANVWPNLQRYVSWMVEAEAALPLAGMLALLVPLRRVWPGAKDRLAAGVIALFVLTLWAQYMFYLVFDVWWYLRFLLASWPFLMLGLASAALALVRSRRPIVRAIIIVAFVGLGVRNLVFAARASVFHLWEGERRYVTMGMLVRSHTEPGSVLISLQHSGSLRYYGGRVTVRFDNVDDDWMDRAVQWLADNGAHPYLVVEEWELPEFRRRFASQRVLDRLQTPVLTYEGGATIFLFDLLRSRGPAGVQPPFVEAYANRRCVPPAPRSSMILRLRQ